MVCLFVVNYLISINRYGVDFKNRDRKRGGGNKNITWSLQQKLILVTMIIIFGKCLKKIYMIITIVDKSDLYFYLIYELLIHSNFYNTSSFVISF